MMKTIIPCILTLLLSIPIFAQQDPDAPGIQDSNIVVAETDSLPPSGLADCDCSLVPDNNSTPLGLRMAYTRICFTLASPQAVQVKVYSITGQEVVRLGGNWREGNQGCRWDASNVGSGIYFCKIITHDKTLIKKLTIIK